MELPFPEFTMTHSVRRLSPLVKRPAGIIQKHRERKKP
ncbi:hypothetical protein LptCag_1293 [Leptospirillum ferriphilum]|uniref:Uncharacterized protein n=1 Tax=Leptospirillum ferriphilum TaxID=178606 RepID=A0A094YI94_9BACT|nr:hypothetical protein LptCag_1293 [Leptospirillum ferriphilum]